MPVDLSFSLLSAVFSLSVAGSSHSSHWGELPFVLNFLHTLILLISALGSTCFKTG